MGGGVRAGGAENAPSDFYRLLQVDPDVPQEIIVEAYWYLVTRLQNGRKDKPGLRDQLDALNEAYATVISPKRRKVYDATLPRVTKLRGERDRAARSANKRQSVSLFRGDQRARRPRGRPDYYAALYLDPSAEPAVVDRAYSILRVLQSDGLVASPAELAEAHAVLADPDRRAAYDGSPIAPPELEASLAADTPVPEAPVPPSDSPVSEAEVSRDVLTALAAAARGVGRAIWRGLATGARLSRRFASWTWPIVRVRSRQFAAWAWPIVRKTIRWLAVHAWLTTKAGARGAAWGTRQAVRHALAWWREHHGSPEPVEDSAVRSRLSRELTGGGHSGSHGEGQPPDAAEQPTARLIVEQGPKAGAVIELQGEPVTLGAAATCDLCLADDEGEVEAEHARIWPRQDRFIIRQLGGRPCIRVDGQGVPWAVLEDGDRIEIGPHVVRFQLAEPETDTSGGAMPPTDTRVED